MQGAPSCFPHFIPTFILALNVSDQHGRPYGTSVPQTWKSHSFVHKTPEHAAQH